MSRIVTRNEALSAGTKIRCIIGNIHGDAANQRFIDFCGKNVVDEIDRIQQDAENRAFVYFEKKEGITISTRV